MKTDFTSDVLPWLLAILGVVISVVIYFGHTRPEQNKCEAMGGEVDYKYKGQWECEVPLHVVFDRTGL